jgi:NAD(P)-dependent dehydrogenase (short-subunit alcohol dehydrogenase family)
MTSTLFITGATSGFGEACARKFAQAGWKLVLTGRRKERLNALCRRACPSRPKCMAWWWTCVTARAMETAIANLPPSFSTLRGLINNAGLAVGTDPAPQCKLDDWETMVDTNIKGPAVHHQPAAAAPDRLWSWRRDHQPGFYRGQLPVPGQPRVWRHQGVCEAILPEPALRSARHRRTRELTSSRVCARANSPWCASAAIRRATTRPMQGADPIQPARYCRDHLLGDEHPGTCEHQSPGTDARQRRPGAGFAIERGAK